ncbi:hypothetical protein [Amycolatopsis sp. DG1A-15b]|uniref:hypothetical protein n=1 Tax=Amycolatopsis sp. DG1A-15b TaxID=3052846 RepID=UPI00255B74B2|nr:hypothetical protein [Amycolatopsis sp. DG1A-15b]WIX89056.1 hypothetical protein QRY02_00975 [Amycolatopsis sp. DG1A-15b]
MGFTKILIAAVGPGVGDAVPLATALAFVLGLALRPAYLRERRRGKVVRQIQRSAKKTGEFTERQEKLLCALLEVPVEDERSTPGEDRKPPPEEP